MQITTLVTVVLFWVLVFAVVDVTRRATRLVRILSDRRVAWPDRTMKREQASSGLQGCLLETWITFRAIVALTKSVNVFIYFPFIVLLLLIVARTTAFDSLNLPLPLVLLFGVALAHLMYCSATLRRAAEHARQCVLDQLDEKLLLAKAGNAAGENSSVTATESDPSLPPRAQLEEVRRQVEHTREGAFAPFMSQPFVKAVMLPLGGFGGLSLVEYFAIASF
jgi:hypothetical protein